MADGITLCYKREGHSLKSHCCSIKAQLRAQSHYQTTEKGKATRSRYNTSPKGKICGARYRTTTSGILMIEIRRLTAVLNER